MNQILNLFLTFLKVGAFSFGGGYTIISLLGNYLEKNNWMSANEYTQIVTISQMTPGPIAINAATYAGAKIMGGGWMSVAGSLTATVAVALPSFAFVILAAKLFDKISHSALYEFSMRGVRPAVIGFLVSAVIFFGNLAFLSENGELNFWGPGICALCFFLNYKKQLGAIYIILISAAIGLAVF